MAHSSLAARVPSAPVGPEEVLDRFLGWVADQGLEPYPAQEEALLECLAGRHVVLGTPTGSGKSLVALGLHFKARCERRRSFYTAPTKALVSEKFFALCEAFEPEQVGMLTGDASINRRAPILCCTAEVLANMALREGPGLDAPYVVMDEFHYYGDRERGTAWQVPLLVLRDTGFLLMSATLGDPSRIAERLLRDTGREVAVVASGERPVPLEFEYRETPIHETVKSLLERGRAPLYIVHFTQRECAEQAQALTSVRVTGPEQRRQLARLLEAVRFDTPYGRDVRRFLLHGIGIHHAGLLPRYRLLVEQLAQRGLLQVICGTDTLGVGVNIPIRSVVFSGLAKFDGEKLGLLSVREFRQIAGRAGRKGFDERGWVVCQAPQHLASGRRREGATSARRRRPPPRRAITWNRQTFERLVTRPAETLEPRFDVSHGLLVSVMQRPDAAATPSGGYREVGELIKRCHLGPAQRSRLRRRAAQRFRSLRLAGVVKRSYDPELGRARVRVDPELQWDFSLHQTLSLFLVEALDGLDPMAEGYALEVITLVESILEDPVAVLRRQADRARRELLARLKAQGVPYEERLRRLEEVSHPKPDAAWIQEAFELFARGHPWVGHEDLRPKSVAREMFEGYQGFSSYVRDYGLQRSEGLLLRYLGQVLHTLQQSVPERARTDAVHDALSYFRTLVARIDSSLLTEWESRRAEVAAPAAAAPPAPPRLDERAFAARVRAELQALVRALAAGDYDEAARCVASDPDDPWTPARFADALRPFLAEHERIVFEPRARQSRYTRLVKQGPQTFEASQVLVDPRDENLWCVEGWVEVEGGRLPEGPLLRLRRIGS